MRVLINAASGESGGSATYLAYLLISLAESPSAHQYLIVVPSGFSWNPETKSSRIRLIPAGVGPHKPWLRMLWEQLVLRRILRKEKVDLLFSAGNVAMLNPPCPQVVLIRNSLFFSPLYARIILPMKKPAARMLFFLRRWLICFCARSARLVLTPSESMRGAFLSYARIPAERCRSNLYGIRLESFPCADRPIKPPRERNPLSFLYVTDLGREGDYKNVRTLLQAFRLLKEHETNPLTLTLTMTQAELLGYLPKELRTYVRQNLLSSLHLVGSLPHKELVEFYRSCDIFIFPSLTESFGHPLVEALASGLPVIASDIPICREICGAAALYFNPLDSSDLAEKLHLLCCDPGLRSHLGKLGRKRVETFFDWRDHVKRLMETLEEAASGTAEAK